MKRKNKKENHYKFNDIEMTTRNILKCPICGSINLSNIRKATKVGLFGIFGAGDLGNTCCVTRILIFYNTFC